MDAANPAMILLYGSFATGDHVELNRNEKQLITHEFRSDFDFLVIVRDGKAKRDTKLWDDLGKRFAERHLNPVSIDVETIAGVNRELKEGSPFYINVKRDGVMLHDSQQFTLSRANQLSPAEQLTKRISSPNVRRDSQAHVV